MACVRKGRELSGTVSVLWACGCRCPPPIRKKVEKRRKKENILDSGREAGCIIKREWHIQGITDSPGCQMLRCAEVVANPKWWL